METMVRYGKNPSISKKQRAILKQMAQQYLPELMVAEWLGQKRLPFKEIQAAFPL